MTCITTLLRSLEDLGYASFTHFVISSIYFHSSGGFDVPKSKCPPDRGSSDCVTGGPALNHSSAFNPSFYSSPSLSLKDIRANQSFVYPPTPPTPTADIVSFPHSPVVPQPIPALRTQNFSHGIATPPLTPDDATEDVSVKSIDDSLELLTTLFPDHAIKALPYAKSVSISSPEMGTSFDGVVLELPGGPKTFYVDGKSAEVVNVRERCANFWFMVQAVAHCSSALLLSWIFPMSTSNVQHS